MPWQYDLPIFNQTRGFKPLNSVEVSWSNLFALVSHDYSKYHQLWSIPTSSWHSLPIGDTFYQKMNYLFSKVGRIHVHDGWNSPTQGSLCTICFYYLILKFQLELKNLVVPTVFCFEIDQIIWRNFASYKINATLQFDKWIFCNTLIIIGAELAGAAGARASPLFTPHPKIYSIKCAYLSFWGENSQKFPVVHLHYLEHLGASAHSNRTLKNEKKIKWGL